MAGNNMRDIKRRIKSNTSMEQITKAMKLVSAAKLRKAKSIFDRIQENFNYVSEAIEEVFYNADEVPDKYLVGGREIKRTAYIVITSNRGLCGSFNSNVIKEAVTLMENDPGDPVIIAIGSRGRDYFAKRNYEICAEYMLPPEDISFLDVWNIITRPVVGMYNRGEIDRIVLVSTRFISTLTQETETQTLLPLEVGEKYLGMPALPGSMEYGPSVEEVFNYLVPKYVEIRLYSAIVESATSEHAARRMAMENATDNANEMISELTMNYNRARQAAITREITEIVGGAEALA